MFEYEYFIIFVAKLIRAEIIEVMTKELKSDYPEILMKVRKIVRSINLESKKIQKQYGVSIPQILCLNYIKNSKKYQTTQKEIRKFLNLNSSTVTGIIYRLEKHGYIARLPKFADKRVTYIALTARGKELLERIPPLLHEQLSSKIGKLPPEKVSAIESSLDELISLLNIEHVDASPVLTYEEDFSNQTQAE